jgi:hypothetical protein
MSRPEVVSLRRHSQSSTYSSSHNNPEAHNFDVAEEDCDKSEKRRLAERLVPALFKLFVPFDSVKFPLRPVLPSEKDAFCFKEAPLV